MAGFRIKCTDTVLRSNGYSSYTLNVSVEDVVDDDVLTTLYDTFTVTISGLPTTTSTTPTTTATSTTTAAIDVPIEFTSPNYTTYYVCESDQADEEVVALAAKRGDTFDGFSFSIVSPQTKFKINNDTKLVVAGNNSFDAESGETSYNLTLKVVLASDSTKSATVNITIIVDDVNDNYPVFSNLSYSFAILEGSPAGNTIGLVSATDADATAPNNVTFFQINGTAEFKISNKGAITIASNVSLDYAKQSSYSFTVTATDGGTDGSELNSSVNVQVTIETRPKFAYEGVINASISEDIGQQAFVLSISASDSDRSPNPNLMFDLSAAPTVASMFKLNGSNLTTADSTFDFENQTFYPFIVGASDGKYFKYHILQIFVLDVNEPPRFNSSVFTAMVPDNLLGGAIVTTVVATDPDSTAPNNTILSYNINGSSELRISNEGVITLQNGFSLDYRNTPYNLIVTATDGGTNGSALTGTASVIVHIESVPKFSASHVRTALIREDISKQSSVMSLTASDSDAAPNTTLMFDIVSQTPTSPVMFKVIGTTLTTSNETFDYENQTLYSVVVRAYGGKYDSTLSLNISVDDVNDNPPRFNSSVFTKSIVENFTIDGVVVRVAASDNDATPEFANTSYSISAGNENNTFLIDKDTGDIKLQSVPLQQRYNLTVKAQDKNKNSLSSETNLTIIVDGGVVNECVSNPCQNNGTCTSFVNNYLCTCQQGWTGIRCETNVPIEFTSPNYTTYYVCESDQADEEVVALAAKRGDTFDGFSFSIVSPQTKFKINNDKKLVVAGNNSFDAESGETSYNLTLKVVHASDSTKSATVNITIIVDDVNDKYPVFSNLSYSFAILEGSPAGNIIGLVSATDADATAPNNVTSFQINGTAEFIISNRGAITIANNVSLEYAKQSRYSFTVTATDGGTDGSELNSSVNVQVTIETLPKFANGDVTHASIREDIGQQAFVLSFSASDSDRSPNPNLIFDLSAAPTVASIFKLNGSNLTTADSTFDFENKTAYTFAVRASDGKYEESHVLQIFVLDVNEPPQFNSSLFIAKVPDNLLGGAIVTTVVATDPDSTAPNNTILSYNISGSSELRISNKGEITLQNGFSLDYRNTPYNLIVAATDGGTNGSALTGTVSVIVNIESVPKFSASHVRTALIREDISKQSSVMSLTASDRDAAPNPTLMFDIVSQTPTSPVMFKVIGTTLTTSNKTFDFENQTLYSVVVRAYDGKYDSTLSLNISVDDVNDNPPRFNPSVFTKSIVENFTIDGVVVRVAARDDDATPEFAKTSYSISAGNENNTFLIDKDTGDIKLQSVPLQQRYNLMVKAQDKHKNSLSSETNLTIIVDGGVVNECVSNPCQNNGTCTSYVNNYLCTCQQGWTGIRCETNINECEGVVCDNNGTCVDHINSFKCNCSAGWKGTLCKEACTNNTYGRNCAQECQCEPAKLPADVGFPTCDIVTGHCKCSKFWTGAACETDVNECYMVPDPCNIKEKNRVCKNTIPKFDCVCKYGFIETNSTCIEAPKNCGTVNENSKNVTFNLDLTPNCNFSYLSCKEEHLNNANKTCLQLRYADSCEVCDVREGSLVVELNVVVDKNPTKMAQFAQELQSIRDGKEEIVYGDKTYTIQSIYVSTIPLNRTKAGNDTNKHLCEVYAIIAQCNSCEVDKDTNLTYCKEKKQGTCNLCDCLV
ncbi:protocadherin Fat 4-like [Dreissena polymorpha]|uniref:protocadherin Fat 4-like n=1 Tax=Dreissena polymorpha TaxID=45954 RepID=UPI0022643637|nr:protocadherin Fat 4-like [Dreissena polymorpha]